MANPDKSFALIEEIQKHPYIYNYTMPEYSRKDLLEMAWQDVADMVNATVTECKEKWRNIRSCFLRDLKMQHNGRKPKRPYYLRETLQFLAPFMKSASQTNDDASPDEDDTVEESFIIITDDSPSRRQSPRSRKRHKIDISEEDEQNTRTKTDRIKKPVFDKTYAEYLQLKKQYARDGPSSPMHHFMLSLLPEFDTMTEQQIRHFKIEVMLLIDKIKSNQESSDDDHLQATSSNYVKYEDL